MKKILALGLLLAGSGFAQADPASAIFAGGCFWCMESAFQETEGVTDVVSGFSGGELPNPTYAGDHQGHFEVVEVSYDDGVISYQELLQLYWVNVDPFDNGGQFCDRGFSYRSAIFPGNASERDLVDASVQELEARFPGKTIHTEVRERSRFWPVEEGHQDYYLKNPLRYKYYRWNCGRDQRLEQIWGQSH